MKAARQKPSICRIQLVSGFQLVKIWATNLSNNYRSYVLPISYLRPA